MNTARLWLLALAWVGSGIGWYLLGVYNGWPFTRSRACLDVEESARVLLLVERWSRLSDRGKAAAVEDLLTVAHLQHRRCGEFLDGQLAWALGQQ